MAATPKEALGFLEDLARRTRPYALRDMEQLTTFARAELGLAEVRAWDVPYATEKLRQRRYDYSDQEVKQYFPEDAVLSGLFRLIETLYGVKIRAGSAPVYHPDVRFHEITDAGGARVGQFYLDLYAREGKRPGAWMHGAIERRARRAGGAGDGHVQTPVAMLTCNFSAPVGGKPALFTHREVVTLFHEFGHGLHQLLTQVDELGVSGINGVEWDAVELPSQFMENFCWGARRRHVDVAPRRHGRPHPGASSSTSSSPRSTSSAAWASCASSSSVLFDMRLHYDSETARAGAMRLLEDVRRQVAVYPVPDYERFPNQFMHIFGGGYAAGYYSYKWAEVLSADAYGAFEEGGVLNPEVGGALPAGGARPGRQPSRTRFIRRLSRPQAPDRRASAP
jgi:oligopeptidase A